MKKSIVRSCLAFVAIGCGDTAKPVVMPAVPGLPPKLVISKPKPNEKMKAGENLEVAGHIDFGEKSWTSSVAIAKVFLDKEGSRSLMSMSTQTKAGETTNQHLFEIRFDKPFGRGIFYVRAIVQGPSPGDRATSDLIPIEVLQ